MSTKNNSLNSDKLDSMFQMREVFMTRIKHLREGTYPNWPVELSDKKSQQKMRDVALKGVEEMFEALTLLKNWKPHRLTENKDFNKDEFLEEVVDAFNYFFALLILTGTSSDDLYDAYIKKNEKIHARLDVGY